MRSVVFQQDKAFCIFRCKPVSHTVSNVAGISGNTASVTCPISKDSSMLSVIWATWSNVERPRLKPARSGGRLNSIIGVICTRITCSSSLWGVLSREMGQYLVGEFTLFFRVEDCNNWGMTPQFRNEDGVKTYPFLKSEILKCRADNDME